MPLLARVCVGAITGFAVLASVGFVVASLFGMTRLVLLGSIGVIASLSAIAFKVHWPEMSKNVTDLIRGAKRALLEQRWKALGYTAFYAGVVVVLVLVFSNAMYSLPDGVYTGVANNLGDLPFHLQVTAGFLYGHNFPPEHPEFANARFTYPFLCDFLTAMLASAGASVGSAMFMQNVVLAIALVGLLHYWTSQLTGDWLAGLIAPVLVLFSGGLGWWLLFRDARASDNGLIGLLQHLPRSYTIENASNALLRWGNSLTTLFVPQRSILFGMPLSLVIFSLWWSTIGPETLWESQPQNNQLKKSLAPVSPSRFRSTQRDRMAAMTASGVLAGILPLIHTHSFMVVMMLAGCLFLLFPNWRLWMVFFLSAFAIALPEMVWSAHGSNIHFREFVGWVPGWDKGDANVIWFWLVNTGAFIPLLITAIFVRFKGREVVPAPLLRFYAPFLLCFVIPNLVRLAPWDWDNIKVLFYWYLGSVPLVALLLSTWMRKGNTNLRWTAVALLGCLTLAGVLDIIRVISGTESYREFDSDGAAIAKAILRQTGPRAIVLHAPTYNTPVFLTGRRSLLGYPGVIVSHGLEYEERENDIRQIYAGAPDARALLLKYRVGYVLVSPMERSYAPVNDEFWGQFPVVAESGDYRLYKVGSDDHGSEQVRIS